MFIHLEPLYFNPIGLLEFLAVAADTRDHINLDVFYCCDLGSHCGQKTYCNNKPFNVLCTAIFHPYCVGHLVCLNIGSFVKEGL